MNRREFLRDAALAPVVATWANRRPRSDSFGADLSNWDQTPGSIRLIDVTASAGIDFQHNTGAYGGKLLPETLGAGCAFFDYDADGWQDIILINGTDWPGHKRQRSTLKLYRNNRNGTFADVTKAAGLDVEMYGMGVAVGDFNNDGFPDLLVTAVGQNRLFRNTGKGTFVDVTRESGLGGRAAFSTSALWFDFDRDGVLDLFVCNYVRWALDRDVFCSNDGKQKSYCTPEAYRGDTCWLFRNRGDGTFEDVTATSGIFDSSSKSLGAAILDVDGDGWLDLFVANDTQPNKLYRNQKNGTFKEAAVEAGVAFSTDGKARAGMGADAAYLGASLTPSVAVTNFDNEMIGLYRAASPGLYEDVATKAGIGPPSRSTLGFGCLFADLDLDGNLDLIVANGHIDATVRNIHGHVGYAQPPHLFLNDGKDTFRDVAAAAGEQFAAPKVGRGLACGDFDRDGDLDVLITTNGGRAKLFRNDQASGNRWLRFRLTGTKSNRDAIGALVRVFHDGTFQTRMVKSGSSYLSQSELPVTFGLGRRDRVDRVVVAWPSGRVDEFKDIETGRAYDCVEGRGLTAEKK